MPRIEKDLMAGDLRGLIDASDAMFVAEYSGISANEMNVLRKSLRKEGGRCRIIKNSVSIRTFKSRPQDELSGYIDGPTMFVFAGGKPLEVAKLISGFADKHDGFKLKAGFVENSLLDGERVSEIAKLPPKEVLVARLVGGLGAPIVRFLNALNAPLGALVGAVSSISRKTGGEKDDGKGN